MQRVLCLYKQYLELHHMLEYNEKNQSLALGRGYLPNGCVR